MNTTQSEQRQWVALTFLGFVGGLALALPLGVPIFAVLGAMAGTPVVLGIVGLILGSAQWPIICRHMPSSWRWIAGSALGMAVGLTAGVILVEQTARAVFGGPINFRMLGVFPRAASFGTIGVLGGAALGLAQWLVLRRRAASCVRWIYINALSFGAGLTFGSLLADTLLLRAGSLASTAVLVTTGGTAAGLFTAKALSSIFKPRQAHVFPHS